MPKLLKRDQAEKSHDHELESKNYYNKIAYNFNKSWDGYLSSFFKKFIVKNLKIKEDAAVLDIGCANGDLLAMLYDEGDFFYGTGLDISPEMIAAAKEKHPAFNFFEGSAQQLPFPDDAFDVMICSASFHHFPDPLGFLREVERVLRPDGTLVIAEIRIPLYDARKFYNKRLLKNSSEGDVKVYGQAELERLFDEAGFLIKNQKNSFQVQYYELEKL